MLEISTTREETEMAQNSSERKWDELLVIYNTQSKMEYNENTSSTVKKDCCIEI